MKDEKFLWTSYTRKTIGKVSNPFGQFEIYYTIEGGGGIGPEVNSLLEELLE